MGKYIVPKKASGLEEVIDGIEKGTYTANKISINDQKLTPKHLEDFFEVLRQHVDFANQIEELDFSNRPHPPVTNNIYVGIKNSRPRRRESDNVLIVTKVPRLPKLKRLNLAHTFAVRVEFLDWQVQHSLQSSRIELICENPNSLLIDGLSKEDIIFSEGPQYQVQTRDRRPTIQRQNAQTDIAPLDMFSQASLLPNPEPKIGATSPIVTLDIIAKDLTPVVEQESIQNQAVGKCLCFSLPFSVYKRNKPQDMRRPYKGSKDTVSTGASPQSPDFTVTNHMNPSENYILNG